ncbi:hypothetical protein DYQ86_16650 [Acidobacteria bacterium AB60]|nr:hypothetical protein DYQ86_16650 [Acidobacteria bacterium AB60]
MKQNARFRGPSPMLAAGAHLAVFVAGLVASGLLRHGAPFVNPFAPGEQARVLLAQTPAAVRVGAFFLFGSAVPLGIFAVTLVSLLRYLGVRAAGTNIALLGGMTATMALFQSGIAGFLLSLPDVTASGAVVKAVEFLSFLSGGVMYAVGFGLFAAGVSITSYFTRLLPRWLAWFGIVIAVMGELSWFSLLSFPANFLIPVTRYLGFVWMVLAAGVLGGVARRESRVASRELRVDG